MTNHCLVSRLGWIESAADRREDRVDGKMRPIVRRSEVEL
jgi:hypothetical protein